MNPEQKDLNDLPKNEKASTPSKVTDAKIENSPPTPILSLNNRKKTLVISSASLLVLVFSCFIGWNFYKQSEITLNVQPKIASTTAISTNQNIMNNDRQKQLEDAYSKVSTLITEKGSHEAFSAIFEENTAPSLPPIKDSEWQYMLTISSKVFPNISTVHFVSLEEQGDYVYYYAWIDTDKEDMIRLSAYVFHKTNEAWKLTGYSQSIYTKKLPSLQENNQAVTDNIPNLKKQVAGSMPISMVTTKKQVPIDTQRKNNYTTTMNTQTITIEKTKTVKVGDLSITNIGGGHKIIMSGDTKRDGDASFTNLALETPRKLKENTRVYGVEPPFVFDTYLIEPKEVGWDGDSVTLSIVQLPEGKKIQIAQDETKIIEGLTINIVGVYQKIIISNGVARKNFEFILTDSEGKSLHELDTEGQSIVFNGYIMKVDSIMADKKSVQVTIIDIRNTETDTKK